MKQRLVLMLIVVVAVLMLGANSQTNGGNYKYATIDEAPGAAGYWCQWISARQIKRNHAVEKIYFSVGHSSAWDATVTLQFKRTIDSDWVDYDTYTSDTRRVIDDAGAVLWRAGIKNGEYTSGTVHVGFDW